MFKKRISIYVIVRFDLIRKLSEIGKKEEQEEGSHTKPRRSRMRLININKGLFYNGRE